MKFYALKLSSTVDELQAAIRELGSPHLCVWWAPGTKQWCALFGAGIRTEALRDEADVLQYAGERGLEATCTERNHSLIGHGETIDTAIYNAADLFFERYAARIHRLR